MRFAGGPAVAMKRNRTFQEGHTHTIGCCVCDLCVQPFFGRLDRLEDAELISVK